MDTPDEHTPDRARALLIRTGGAAILAGMFIHILVNMFVKQFPPDDAAGEQLRAFIEAELDNWALVHGLRYAAIATIALFAAALFARTVAARAAASAGWGVLGVLGAALMLANLLIVNGIETYIFLDAEAMGENDAVFWALFSMTRVLFAAEICMWAIFLGGFSAAGWTSRTLPRWLCLLGFAHALAALASGVLIVPILIGGPAEIVITIAEFTGLAWFACAGVYLLIRGARSYPSQP